jgi:plastocyanin
MMLTRRAFAAAGGSVLAGLVVPRVTAAHGAATEIAMRGNADGSKVWFDPVGLLVRPGGAVRWVNKDPGNAHTATAFHPANERPLRIPKDAVAWDSGYLLPDESFEVAFTVEGVYDYFCLPHEHAGMAGRIVVAEANSLAALEAAPPSPDLPEAVLSAFPPVERIVGEGAVRPE